VAIADDAFAVTEVPGNIPAGDVGAVEMTFRPTTQAVYNGSATLTVDGISRSVHLSGEAGDPAARDTSSGLCSRTSGSRPR
jgi:hypothetical protein